MQRKRLLSSTIVIIDSTEKEKEMFGSHMFKFALCMSFQAASCRLLYGNGLRVAACIDRNDNRVVQW